MDLDLELQPLCGHAPSEPCHRDTSWGRPSCPRSRVLMVVLVVTLLLCGVLDRYTEVNNIFRVPEQAAQGELQLKYESSSSSDDEQQIPAALDTPATVATSQAIHCCCCDGKPSASVPEVEQLINGKEQLDEERMDLELAYAHGRVLSLKRLLGHKHISHRRIRTSLEHGKERKLVLELEIPQT
eukprot:Skav222166  [mRNA]  locus=scaffold3048:106265:110972:- [translate_table: standard]